MYRGFLFVQNCSVFGFYDRRGSPPTMGKIEKTTALKYNKEKKQQGRRRSGKEAETKQKRLTDWLDCLYLRFRLVDITESAGLLVGWIDFGPAVNCTVPVNKP